MREMYLARMRKWLAKAAAWAAEGHYRSAECAVANAAFYLERAIKADNVVELRP